MKTFCFIYNAGSKLTDSIEVWRQHCYFGTVHPSQDVPEHLMDLLLSWTNGAVGYMWKTWFLNKNTLVLTLNLLNLFVICILSSKEGSRDTVDRSNDADLSSAAVYSSAHETRAPGTQDTPDTRPDSAPWDGDGCACLEHPERLSAMRNNKELLNITILLSWLITLRTLRNTW